MGGALARALLDAGRRVTVWNRTEHKVLPFAARGAQVAPSAVVAAMSSPITIICMSSYEAATDALAAASDLRGRTLVQLSSGTPGDARDTARWAADRGADYLDGAILAWPRQIGGPDAALIVSGPTQVYDRAASTLRALSGSITHFGEPIAGSSALAAATLAYLAGRWIGFIHGALICEAEGLDVEAFGAMLADLSPLLGEDDRHMGAVVARDRFAEPESTLGTAGRDVIDLLRHAQSAAISTEFPAFAAGLFRRGIDAGYGAEEHVALIKLLRTPRAA